MKKKLTEYLIAALVIGVCIYALAAFVVWDLNPGRWGEFARLMAGFWFLVANFLYTINRA